MACAKYSHLCTEKSILGPWHILHKLKEHFYGKVRTEKCTVAEHTGAAGHLQQHNVVTIQEEFKRSSAMNRSTDVREKISRHDFWPLLLDSRSTFVFLCVGHNKNVLDTRAGDENSEPNPEDATVQSLDQQSGRSTCMDHWTLRRYQIQ